MKGKGGEGRRGKGEEGEWGEKDLKEPRQKNQGMKHVTNQIKWRREGEMEDKWSREKWNDK